MNTVSRKTGQKVENVQELTITKRKLHQTINKQKNWSASRIDGKGKGLEVYAVQY